MSLATRRGHSPCCGSLRRLESGGLYLHPSSQVIRYRKNWCYCGYTSKKKTLWTWKLTQLKKLKFEEVKAEFENLTKQLDTYVPMNLEATKESLKRFGEELQTKTAKKLKFDDENTLNQQRRRLKKTKMISQPRRLKRGENR
ncbi:hypothetical protein Tco_0102676 [Tanacetum coccineum]